MSEKAKHTRKVTLQEANAMASTYPYVKIAGKSRGKALVNNNCFPRVNKHNLTHNEPFGHVELGTNELCFLRMILERETNS